MLSAADLPTLDEPSNHLDRPSLLALEQLLRDDQGALEVVSHDDAFLDALDAWSAAPRAGGWSRGPERRRARHRALVC
ncbi:hypothetical protein [Marichromatium gracile]|uniref:ABC transporter family protein n=1 Tax=Marichromatium gracile TaxID=1048 RepID=A0A4R4A4U4_MARGR|nr:hypothetical protein [Marichromatium gracile]MBK1710627.1 hypothetical protein [Marichromatium gracile]TCW33214.1 hypothetical protein EDC29_11654 [Marichromatium gracile]